jgi:hypothetical protein
MIEMLIVKTTKAKLLFFITILILCSFVIYMFTNKEKDISQRINKTDQIQQKNPDEQYSIDLTNIEKDENGVNEKTLKHNVVDESFDFIDDKIIAKSDYSIDKAVFEMEYTDPRKFVKLKWRGGIPRETAIRIITKDKLSLLHEMLKDPDYAPYWHNVAMLICYISDNPASVPVLMDYFQRYDEQQSREYYPSKIGCIADIGRIAKKEANDLLRKAITNEGAVELSQAWIDKGKPGDFMGRKEAIDHIRLCAMEGLIYTGIKENLELIESIYEKEYAIFKDTGELSDVLFDSAGALATRDYIEENGLDALRNLETGDGSKYLGIMDKYVLKYIDFKELNKAQANESQK